MKHSATKVTTKVQPKKVFGSAFGLLWGLLLLWLSIRFDMYFGIFCLLGTCGIPHISWRAGKCQGVPPPDAGRAPSCPFAYVTAFGATPADDPEGSPNRDFLGTQDPPATRDLPVGFGVWAPTDHVTSRERLRCVRTNRPRNLKIGYTV